MKTIIDQINRILRVGLSAILAMVILCSGLMLCCQVGFTSVRATAFKAKSCCHLPLSAQLKTRAEKDCSCCGLIKNVFNISEESVKAVRSSGLMDLSLAAISDHLLQFFHPNSGSLAAGHGPPWTNSSVPLYLQHSNLRL